MLLRRTAALVLLSLVSACDSPGTAPPDGGGTADLTPAADGGADTGGPDQPAAPVLLTVDSYNVALAGAFINGETERRQGLLAALADSPADVLCIQEAWQETDKQAIIAAAKKRLPYSLSFQHDQTTPVQELEQPGCEIEPEPTTPPCAGELADPMNAIVDCLRDNCSTQPGSDEGQTTSTDCAMKECLAQAASLVLGDRDQQRCYGCIAPNLPTETFASIRNTCTNDVGGGLAFGGQNGLVILSKYPLSNTGSVVLPGTWNRRIVASATVTLPDQSTVDVYCNHVSAIFNGVGFPYTGRFGCGETNAKGWEAEQKLQIERLMSYVEENSGAGGAIILGDFNASRASGDGSVTAEAEDNYEILASGFTEAVPEGYTPICTYCPDNPLNGPDTPPVWLDHIFLKNLESAEVRSLERIYTEQPVMAAGPDGKQSLPLSDHYGLRTVLSLAP